MMDGERSQPDELRMRRCFDIARLGISDVKTNPMVGAMIVKGNKVISEGYHQYFGGPHAEVNAILSTRDSDLKDSSIYVSLEPCSHHGKTPPCADLVIDKGLERCVISDIDPNPMVCGQGIQRLRSAGIKVSSGIGLSLSKEILKSFFIQQKYRRPYIILKWAQSRDGFVGKRNQRTKISSPVTDRLVHKWRSESDSIMLGSQTVRIDQPQLSNRWYFGKNPIRVILDRSNQIEDSASIWKAPIRTFYFTNNIRKFSNPLIESFTLSAVKEPLGQIFSHLYDCNIGSVLVEGGPTLLKACMNLQLWDEARVITSRTCLIDGLTAPAISGDPTLRQQIGCDEISLYYRQ